MKVSLCAQDGRLLACWANFFNHVRTDIAQSLHSDTINQALREYNGMYHVVRAQDYGYEEFVEFENENDYAFFLLRWT